MIFSAFNAMFVQSQYKLVLEYWYTANMVIVSVFDALSIGSDPMAAVDLCIKRAVFY